MAAAPRDFHCRPPGYHWSINAPNTPHPQWGLLLLAFRCCLRAFCHKRTHEITNQSKKKCKHKKNSACKPQRAPCKHKREKVFYRRAAQRIPLLLTLSNYFDTVYLRSLRQLQKKKELQTIRTLQVLHNLNNCINYLV